MIKIIINYLFFNKFFEKKLEQAYKILEQKKKIEKIYEIKEILQHLQISETKIENSFTYYDLDINLSLKQFIYSKLINTPYFTSKLMFAMAYNEKFYFPIPRIYLDEICKFTKVNFFKSKILLILSLTFYLIYQFFFIIKNIIYFSFSKKTYNNKIFLNSIPDLYSDITGEIKNYDFFKWVIDYFKLNSKVNFFHNNKLLINKKISLTKFDYKIFFLKNPFINFYEFSNLKFYFKAFLKTLYLTIKIFFVNKLEFLFLIKEIFFFYFLKELPNHFFYNYCLFNNSNMVYRPLWTYVNEKKNKGSVILYFYSTNMMPLLQEIDKKKYFEVYGYSLQSWPAYIAWNEFQKDWLKSNITNNSIFCRESLIPFSGKHVRLEKKKKTITIFDVPPKRTGIYYLLNNPYNIYTIEYCQKFLKDILDSIPENYSSSIDLILKLKKDYNNIHHNYRTLIDSLSNNKKIRLIKDISPESIIEISDATISIPFTSPAISSFNKNKETIYYDPSGQLTKENCLEKRVNLISSKDNLEKWLYEILNK